MKKKKKFLWIVSMAVVIVLITALILFLGKKEDQNTSLRTAVVTESKIEITVTATGEIQPVYKVDVGTQVSGIVQKLYVDFNSIVQKGDLLAELDRSTLQEQVHQSQAMVSNAESNLTLAKQNYDRTKLLYDNKAATQADFEEASNQYIQAKNQLLTANSDLQRNQVNLSYTQIFSPISGVVLNKEVEEGQTVASSFSTPTLFTIANDLTQMQVEADVDEADIGQVKVGQKVTFTVDAFPDDIFEGTVKQIRLNPITSSNVVTYTVIIDAPNPKSKLFPGMTANVTIIVNEQMGLSIPMEALYFVPDPLLKKKLEADGYVFQDRDFHGEKVDPSVEKKRKMIWVKNGKNCTARWISIGLNDGANVIVMQGLNANNEVIVSKEGGRDASGSKAKVDNPLMMRPPQQKQR